MRSVSRIALALGAVLLAAEMVPNAQGQPPPILLVVNSAAPNPFGPYLGEILRTEGLNTFATVELSALNSATLNAARLVVLAETPLTSSQASMLSGYVAGGGRLVAMRPDAQLSGVLGVTDVGPSSAERYLSINGGTLIGYGFPATTLPLNGPVQHYRLGTSATALATLYTDRATSTSYPAVVQSGKTVTWAYDLAKSVVYTRQGNPANAGVERDGVPPLRTTDVFYNAIDLDRVNVPHADIQMRLFSRAIADLLADVLPLPRLWYFPGAARTVMVPTADTHVYNDNATRTEIASVEARGARLTLYVTRWIPYPDATEAATWRATGHEIGLHPYGNADGVSIDTAFQNGLDWFTAHGLGAPSRTVRIHQIEWPSWVGPAQTEANFGIGLDTTFYTWGPAVTYPDGHQAHGFINGSGLPMRFVDQSGALFPVYQQVTSIIDEQLIPVTSQWAEQLSASAALAVSRQIIDDSQAGGYSALVTQFHTDYFTWGEVQPWAEGTMDYARSLGIPMWTAERWLNYIEARAATSVTNLAWSAPSISFTVTVPVGAEAQSLVLPASYGGLGLTTLTVDGTSITPVVQTITGRNTLFFSVGPGTHTVAATFNTTVPPVNHPPTAVNDTTSVTQGAAVTTPVLANDSDPDGDALAVTAVTQGSRGTVVVNPDNTVTYTAGATCGPDSFTYTISDGRGGTSTASVNVSIACTGGQVTQTTAADFGSCAAPAGTLVTTVGDGEVRLAGTFGDEYAAATLNAAQWVAATWAGGAYTPALAGGVLSIAGTNGAFVRSASPLGVTTLETTARFSAVAWEHVGWGDLDLAGTHYLLFSTYNSTTNLYARSSDGSGEQRTDLGAIPVGFHTYRIDRAAQTSTTDLVSYFVDGVLRAQHTVATVPAQYVYQSYGGGLSPTLDIDKLWVYPTHVASGTFQSCVIDAGSSVTWTAASWSASVPAGTSLQVATRTSADSATWSNWSAPLASSGSTVASPAGRYLQYQLSLGSGSAAASPVISSVTLDNRIATDTTPPTVSGVVVSGVTASAATISWSTLDEVSTSQVQYGPTVAYGFQTALDEALVNAHAQALSGLAPGTLYHVRALSRDAAGNQAASGDVTFTTAAPPPNRPPVAVNDTASVVQGGAVTIPVLANDSDPDGDPLSVTAVTPATLGTVAINADGTLAYTSGSACAADSFTYSISDGRGGTATATVSVTCAGGQMIQTSAADFGACGLFTNTMLTAVGNGEVRLAGSVGDEYGAALLDPARWVIGTWSGGTYAPILTGGVLSVAGTNGAFVRSATSLPVTTLEATAQFSGAAWEHLGWAALDFAGPYLVFSTAGSTTNLYARSADNGGEQRTDLGPIPVGFHTYRIERATDTATTDLVRYYIDGALRAQHTVATVPALYVYQSHNGGVSPTLDIDRVWVYPSYVPGGTFESCALDAGSSVTWTTASWTATVPATTTLAVATRTSADGVSWNAWSAPLASTGSAITSPPGRYIQFQLSLATGSVLDSPVVDSVALSFSATADTTPPVISAVTAGGVSTSGATIAWTTDEAATSLVQYGVTSAYGLTTTLDAALVTGHAQSLAGLAPNTLYHYSVQSRDASGNTATSGDFTLTTSSCTYTISPTAQAFSAGGGTGSVALSAGGGCTWTAVSNSAWITLTSSATGSGSATVTYAVATNGAATARNGTVTVAGQVLSVSQAAQPTLSISDVTVTEGNSGTTNAAFTVTLSAATSQTVTVAFATANGTATAGSDYTAVSGTLTFAPGTTTQGIAVPVTGDTLNELDEAFTVNLSAPVAATISKGQGIGTILNDDPLPSISINDVTVTEGNTGNVNATFTVTLSAASGRTVTAAYATADGTATAGSDYIAASGTVTFAAGVASRTFSVVVSPDTVPEADETFFVNLSAPTNATITKSQGLGTILNNDGTVTVTSPNTAVNWGIGSTRQITWNHTLGVGSTMRLELSRDGGTTWELVNGAVPNSGATTGTYNWVVTGPATTTARIRATWTGNSRVTDIGNVNFTIAAPFVTVAAPSSTATNWGYGTQQGVSWTTNLGPLDTVNVRMSTDGGASFPIVLASSIAASPTSTVITMPTLVAATTTARVRVEWVTNTTIQGTNPSNFNVQPPFVTVTNPNSASTVWSIGTAVPIRWNQNLGSRESVRIDLSIDGGATYPIPLFASTAANSAPSVTVLSAWATTQGRVRVTWLVNGAVTDISNNNFAIR